MRYWPIPTRLSHVTCIGADQTTRSGRGLAWRNCDTIPSGLSRPESWLFKRSPAQARLQLFSRLVHRWYALMDFNELSAVIPAQNVIIVLSEWFTQSNHFDVRRSRTAAEEFHSLTIHSRSTHTWGSSSKSVNVRLRSVAIHYTLVKNTGAYCVRVGPKLW